MKDAINRDKHGVSLAFGARLWLDTALLVVPTTRLEDGEQRFRALGSVEGRLWTAVHVYRGAAIRMISVRKSNNGERSAYHRATG